MQAWQHWVAELVRCTQAVAGLKRRSTQGCTKSRGVGWGRGQGRAVSCMQRSLAARPEALRQPNAPGESFASSRGLEHSSTDSPPCAHVARVHVVEASLRPGQGLARGKPALGGAGACRGGGACGGGPREGTGQWWEAAGAAGAEVGSGGGGGRRSGVRACTGGAVCPAPAPLHNSPHVCRHGGERRGQCSGGIPPVQGPRGGGRRPGLAQAVLPTGGRIHPPAVSYLAGSGPEAPRGTHSRRWQRPRRLPEGGGHAWRGS